MGTLATLVLSLPLVGYIFGKRKQADDHITQQRKREACDGNQHDVGQQRNEADRCDQFTLDLTGDLDRCMPAQIENPGLWSLLGDEAALVVENALMHLFVRWKHDQLVDVEGPVLP